MFSWGVMYGGLKYSLDAVSVIEKFKLLDTKYQQKRFN
jgi:hypothetical protein